MKFTAYLRRDPTVDRDALPATGLPRLERELDAGADLARLVSLGPEVVGGLSAAQLVAVRQSHRRHRPWRARATEVGRRLESIEREVVSRTTTVHQLATLERGLRLCNASRVEAADRAGVLSTCLEIWEATRVEARRNGTVRTRAARPDHPALAQYDDYLERAFELDSLRPHRWLAMRRGEREGVLSLELDLGAAPLTEQVALRMPRLGNAARDRTEGSLLQELVLDDLEAAVLDELDEWAGVEALRTTALAYAGLLGSRPLKVDRLAAVHLGAPSQPVGLAVLDGNGAVLDSLELDTSVPGWLDRAVDLVREANLRELVVPSDTTSSKRLAELQSRLGTGVVAVPVRPAALTEGRAALEPAAQELPRAVQNAVVLGLRAIDPLKAWGGIDPARAGVGEYQGELDEAELREVLAAVRDQVRRERKRSPAPPRAVGPTAQGPGMTVRTVSELRPGMMLSGTVSNLTGFGAFVSLGLEYEGMIHVSELSDGFVSEPTEVVQIGQKVTARVLAVDPGRRRISLSLRSSDNREPRRGGGGGGGGGDRGERRGASGGRRSQVLRDLDALFKK